MDRSLYGATIEDRLTGFIEDQTAPIFYESSEGLEDQMTPHDQFYNSLDTTPGRDGGPNTTLDPQGPKTPPSNVSADSAPGGNSNAPPPQAPPPQAPTGNANATFDIDRPQTATGGQEAGPSQGTCQTRPPVAQSCNGQNQAGSCLGRYMGETPNSGWSDYYTAYSDPVKTGNFYGNSTWGDSRGPMWDPLAASTPHPNNRLDQTQVDFFLPTPIYSPGGSSGPSGPSDFQGGSDYGNSMDDTYDPAGSFNCTYADQAARARENVVGRQIFTLPQPNATYAKGPGPCQANRTFDVNQGQANVANQGCSRPTSGGSSQGSPAGNVHYYEGQASFASDPSYACHMPMNQSNNAGQGNADITFDALDYQIVNSMMMGNWSPGVIDPRSRPVNPPRGQENGPDITFDSIDNQIINDMLYNNWTPGRGQNQILNQSQGNASGGQNSRQGNLSGGQNQGPLNVSGGQNQGQLNVSGGQNQGQLNVSGGQNQGQLNVSGGQNQGQLNVCDGGGQNLRQGDVSGGQNSRQGNLSGGQNQGQLNISGGQNSSQGNRLNFSEWTPGASTMMSHQNRYYQSPVSGGQNSRQGNVSGGQNSGQGNEMNFSEWTPGASTMMSHQNRYYQSPGDSFGGCQIQSRDQSQAIGSSFGRQVNSNQDELDLSGYQGDLNNRDFGIPSWQTDESFTVPGLFDSINLSQSRRNQSQRVLGNGDMVANVMRIFAQDIETRIGRMKTQMLEQIVPGGIDNGLMASIGTQVPPILTANLHTAMNSAIKTKLKSELSKEMVVNLMERKIGEGTELPPGAIYKLVNDLAMGSFACNKPCNCGPNRSRSQTGPASNTSGQRQGSQNGQGPFPANCIASCPCKQQAPVCPCMQAAAASAPAPVPAPVSAPPPALPPVPAPSGRFPAECISSCPCKAKQEPPKCPCMSRS